MNPIAQLLKEYDSAAWCYLISTATMSEDTKIVEINFKSIAAGFFSRVLISQMIIAAKRNHQDLTHLFVSDSDYRDFIEAAGIQLPADGLGVTEVYGLDLTRIGKLGLGGDYLLQWQHNKHFFEEGKTQIYGLDLSKLENLEQLTYREIIIGIIDRND